MTEATSLIELAERVEAATGPDRLIDAEIAVAIDLKLPWGDDYDARAAARIGGVERLAEMGECHQNVWREYLPRYTASIDAAMSLVPNGWDWCLSHACDGDEEGSFASLSPARKVAEACGNAATPALALCAAALRARASL